MPQQIHWQTSDSNDGDRKMHDINKSDSLEIEISCTDLDLKEDWSKVSKDLDEALAQNPLPGGSHHQRAERRPRLAEQLENGTIYVKRDIPTVPVSAGGDSEKYPAREHASKVAKRLGVTSGLIYLVGQKISLYEDSDMGPIFRQRRYFYYLSGVDFGNCIVTYNIKEDLLTLFVPPIDPKQAIWLGATATIEECKERYDIDEVSLTSEVDKHVLKYLRGDKSASLFILHPDQAPSVIRHDSAASQYKKIVNSTRLQPAMDACRVIKDKYEIGLVRKSNVISGKGHREVMKKLYELTTEADVEAVFTSVCIASQAKQQAYGVIAASGENASTLHYMANNESLEDRQLVCLDAGCEWNCYASDVTRTIPVYGEFSEEAKAIYDIVEEMQETCIMMIKPGASFNKITLASITIAIRGLMKLGLLQNGTPEEYLASGAFRAFFPHGLGHHVGLEVHDVDSESFAGASTWSVSEGNTDVDAMIESMAKISSRGKVLPYGSPNILAPGMIITIEPGIYFNRRGMQDLYLKDPTISKFINKDLLDDYYPVGGVRIEDDILVTYVGFDNLTTAPKGNEMLEIVRPHSVAMENAHLYFRPSDHFPPPDTRFLKHEPTQTFPQEQSSSSPSELDLAATVSQGQQL